MYKACNAVVAGVGIKQVSSVKQMLGKLTSLDSNNYPEMLGRTCIINAPPGFGMMFGMIKPFLDARTRAKVEVQFVDACIAVLHSHTPLFCTCQEVQDIVLPAAFFT